MKEGMKMDHVGEIHVNKRGENMEIIEFFTTTNCTIRFDDGVVMYKRRYYRVVSGSIRKSINRLGEKGKNNKGSLMTIIRDGGTSDLDVQFENGYIAYNRTHQGFKNGTICNPYDKTILGIACKGDGRHLTKIDGKMTKMYDAFCGIIRRCSSQKWHDKQPTYADCEVDPRWLNFQNFGDWFEERYHDGFEVDKDILIKDNRLYSPDTCFLVPQEINLQFCKREPKEDGYPVGVFRTRGRKKKFQVDGKINGTKYFDCEFEGFAYHSSEKETHIKQLADKWKPFIVNECYEALYAHKVEDN